MKKITLLLALVVSLCVSAQQTISFESSEGFTLGNVNGQNGWVSTEDGAGGFVSNQIITDELSADGTASLKITNESAFGGQANPSFGRFLHLPNRCAFCRCYFFSRLVH